MKSLTCLFYVAIIGFGNALPINEISVKTIHPIVPDIVRTSNKDLLRLYESSQDAEVRPGLFEGDIAVTSEYFDYWRIGLRWDVFPDKLWENRTVPYVISALYDMVDYMKIYKAITYINYMTCIKFVPWDTKAKDFLLIWPIIYPKGCWSFVGKFGGAQILSLEPPDEKGPNCLENEGRAIHELMHALGIFHEHSRTDRDMYIDIHYDNIIPGKLINYIFYILCEDNVYIFLFHLSRYRISLKLQQYNALWKLFLQQRSYKTDSNSENTWCDDRPTKSDE
ncbi:ASTA protein, partial [Pseudoatta argentina]